LELSRPEVRSRNTIERLASIPEGLEKLYERMLDDVIASEDSALFKKVLATASIAARPISFLELQSFIQDLENFNAQQMMEMIEECGSFLFARDYVIYFVHQSAQDFLISRTGKSQIFEPTIEGHHLKMLRSALVAMRTLRRNMFNLELPGIMIDDIATPEVDPLRRVRYHCQYWVDHLGHAAGERQRRDDDLVLEFLNSKLLYWIEALSLQRHVPEAVTAAQKLKTIMVRF
jgi:hypothetical protein